MVTLRSHPINTSTKARITSRTIADFRLSDKWKILCPRCMHYVSNTACTLFEYPERRLRDQGAREDVVLRRDEKIWSIETINTSLMGKLGGDDQTLWEKWRDALEG